LAPDVIHTHQVGALFYAGPAARRAAVPVVVHTEHGKHYAARRRTRWIGRLAGRFVQRLFCVSDDIADEVRAARIVTPRKLCVVPNGIDTGRFHTVTGAAAMRASLGIPSDAPVVGTVGRLNEIKRQDILLEAFSRVHAKVPKAHLLIVGDGPLMSELRDLAQKLKVDDAVHFAGYQQRPEAYLAAMDVFALTSRSEGMPLVVLEAWATGVPVVASAVGGLPAMIDHDRTGRLFPPSDVESLASELRHLLTKRHDRQRLAEAGLREVTERYDVAQMARAYDGHYHQLLAGAHSLTHSVSVVRRVPECDPDQRSGLLNPFARAEGKP